MTRPVSGFFSTRGPGAIVGGCGLSAPGLFDEGVPGFGFCPGGYFFPGLGIRSAGLLG